MTFITLLHMIHFYTYMHFFQVAFSKIVFIKKIQTLYICTLPVFELTTHTFPSEDRTTPLGS
jgi:hypothetical protein